MMTRFLYIADTHMCASPMGYQQQKGYPDRLPELLSALSEWVSSNGGVDFILHGGDMIDSTTNNHIAAAAIAFDLAVPVYLCLGNHDLTTPNAAARWLSLAPQFFPSGKPDYTITTDSCVIHVAPNHWCDRPFYWKDVQSPHFSCSQRECLRDRLNTRVELPHILLTHSPAHGLPTDQTGFPEPYHGPNASFSAAITEITTRHPNLKCVLGAHTHMNMRVHDGGTEFVTVSAFVETPFEFKVFQITPREISLSTIALVSTLRFDSQYETGRSFVQGRPCDRSLSITLEQPERRISVSEQ